MAKGRIKTESPAFIKAFEKLTRGKFQSWEVWQDFVVMSACAISNVADRSESHHSTREKMYMDRLKKYDPEEQKVFPELFTELVMALERNQEQDFLGDIFMQLELSSHWKGQFFTPYSVCRMMGDMEVKESLEGIEEKGHISVNDPACGSGSHTHCIHQCGDRGAKRSEKPLELARPHLSHSTGHRHYSGAYVLYPVIPTRCRRLCENRKHPDQPSQLRTTKRTTGIRLCTSTKRGISVACVSIWTICLHHYEGRVNGMGREIQDLIPEKHVTAFWEEMKKQREACGYTDENGKGHCVGQYNNGRNDGIQVGCRIIQRLFETEIPDEAEKVKPKEYKVLGTWSAKSLCGICGWEVDWGHIFCAHCGTEIDWEQEEEQENGT